MRTIHGQLDLNRYSYLSLSLFLSLLEERGGTPSGHSALICCIFNTSCEISDDAAGCGSGDVQPSHFHLFPSYYHRFPPPVYLTSLSMAA